MLMKNTLNIFSRRELDLLDKVKSLSGAFEEKNKAIESLKIYDSYKDIHSQYSEQDDIEALKRAIFIQWYAASEPGIFSGIRSLNKEAEVKNLKKVDALISGRLLDNEFGIMLKHYHAISNWYFNGFKDIDHLKAFFFKSPKNRSSKISTTTDRGQLGKYWESLKAF